MKYILGALLIVGAVIAYGIVERRAKDYAAAVSVAWVVVCLILAKAVLKV